MSAVRLIVVVGSLSCSSLFCARTANAQGPELAKNEIIVTAQRRPEESQDVPLSITALAGEQLERMQATDTAALGKVVPSLVMTRTGPFTQPYIRGVGKRSTLGVENSVATYVDGVYFASPISALLDLRGIERVEVLNGPQGTLFGRNTSGGVIQVVTRDPVPGTWGEGELTTGTYGQLRGDVYLTSGTERLAGNFAASLSRNGGYGTNLFTGKKDQGEVRHSLVARSKWVWRPSSSVKLTLAGDYQDIDQDFSYRPVLGFPAIGQPRVTGFRDGDQDSPVDHHLKYGGASVRAEAEIHHMSLISLTALRQMHARFGNDLDQGPMALWSAVAVSEQRQLSQEFQLQSSVSAPVRWIAGLYYIWIEERYDPTVFGYGGSYSAQFGGRTFQSLFATGRTSSYAGYGQATFRLAGANRLTLGMRYTIDDRSVRATGERQFDNPPFVRPIPGLPLHSEQPLRARRTFNELTWRASLERDFSIGFMGYASASRGFQSGGWNLQTPQVPAFRPENLDAFEAGLKYAGGSRWLRADASVFLYNYSDLQVSAITPLGSVTTNATSARHYGAELQIDARLAEGTDLSFGAQFLNARFKRFPNATCTDFRQDVTIPYAPIPCDVTGNRLPYAPKFKFNLGSTHRVAFGSGSLLLAGNLSFNSGYFAEADNVVRQKPFVSIDASAEWLPASTGLSLRLWVRNLGDAEYFDSVATVATAGILQSPAAPRRFGASIGYQF
jgi:iron complex outermembrane recepter protein